MAVECSSDGDFAVRVTAADHELRADEPRRLGGTETGPSPFDLLLASVGTCTAITIADAARERGLALDGVRVSVKHKLNRLARTPSDPELSITEIRREVVIEGDLPGADREWLFERGRACPVSRMLASGVTLSATLR